MDRYHLTAVVNRTDLRKKDWQDCGEHRLVFALQGGGQKFINFEARLPNPTPDNIAGCAPIIQFWDELATLPPFIQADRIREFFIMGTITGTPVIAPQHFFNGAGQIRSNQFMGTEWLLKEHQLVNQCDFGPCTIFAETVNVKENPFGELFNPNAPFGGSPFTRQAQDFQQDFIASIESLTGTQLGELKTTTQERFNHGQSLSSGSLTFENDYRAHFGGQLNSPFGNDLLQSLQGKTNADGSPLIPEQVLARATALTCAGCHNPAQFGLTLPGSVGTLALPDGRIIDSWPVSLSFFHIDEQGNLSPALEDVFLPIRQADFGHVIAELENTL